jgi:hypothetical protein
MWLGRLRRLYRLLQSLRSQPVGPMLLGVLGPCRLLLTTLRLGRLRRRRMLRRRSGDLAWLTFLERTMGRLTWGLLGRFGCRRSMGDLFRLTRLLLRALGRHGLLLLGQLLVFELTRLATLIA